MRQAVCKKFFLSTLGFAINDSIVKFICEDLNIIKQDHRGNFAKNSKIDRFVIQNHIESFSLCISHYRREHAPNKLYLPNVISITDMFNDFKEKHPNIKFLMKFIEKKLVQK